MEDFYIGGASVKLFLPIFKMNVSEIALCLIVVRPVRGSQHIISNIRLEPYPLPNTGMAAPWMAREASEARN